MKNLTFSFQSRPLGFIIVLLLSNVNWVLTQSGSSEEIECQTLPPPPLMSVSSSHSTNPNQDLKHEDKQQEILNQGMGQLHFDKYDKKAIFMLGNTGSGKTTITQTLNGNLSQLHAVRTQSGEMVIIDDQSRIGLPTTKSKTLVPEYVRNPENVVNDVDKNKLVNIVRNAFAPTNIECLSNGRKAVVTGNFVKFTDFITSSGEPRCGSNVKELEIFASEKLFFDRDILAIGRGLTIRVIADVWEVIDTRKIDLKGANGEPHAPAKAQGFSVNGKPGKPGGNGGNFYGIYCTIVNGDKLNVNVNGGNGGDGQEGANGKDGVKGRDATRGDFPKPQNRHSVSWERKGPAWEYGVHFEQRHVMAGGLGEVGGNGGNGGSGGEPGYPGTVFINRAQPYPSSNSHNDILVRSQRGNPGQPGKGGEKGLGGRKGHSYSCFVAYTVFTRYWRKCQVEPRDEQASSGRDGLTGGNSNGKIYPTQPIPFAGKISSKTVSDFKHFMLEGGSCKKRN